MSTICIFSALFPPSMGGVERFTDCLSAELAHEGHSVVVVTNNTHGLDSKEMLHSGVQVVRLPCVNLVDGRYPVPVRNALFYELMNYLNDIEFDGVLVNARFYLHSLLGVQFARRQGLRAVVLDHGSAYLTLGSRVLDRMIKFYEDCITSYLRRLSVDFYGISAKSAEWLKHFGIVPKGVIGNAIDAASFRGQASNRSYRDELGIADDALLLSFTGRLVPEKGIDVLLETMGLLHEYPVELVVAGDGPLLSSIEDAHLSNVHAVGRLEQPDIAALLLESDLFCLPTRSEGFCTSLLESAACGTPFLVTDVGGAKEIAPNEDYGFITDSANASEFASIVNSIIDSQVDLQHMGGLCASRVESTCSWSAVASILLAAFD
ncbi:glycosyltransferase family 4 protein [Collinsella intestinalis]|nr:glycosyltransferase family 4 protein [Collinsella intestinalis]